VSKKTNWLDVIKNIGGLDGGASVLRKLLNENEIAGYELEVVGRFIGKIESAGDFNLIRVAVLSSTSTAPLVNAVRVSCLRIGCLTEIYEAPFSVIHPEFIDSNSGLYNFKPDIILLDVGYSGLEYIPSKPLSLLEVNNEIESVLSSMQMIWDIVRERLRVPMIQHTIVMPSEMMSGVAERSLSWGRSNYINKVNEIIIENSPNFVRWCDTDALSRNVGLINWHDPRLLHHAKYGFSTKYLPEYTNLLIPAFMDILSMSPKALILDCDNTLWGGVVGDDGLDGIRLGPDSVDGEAYYEFCKYVKDLSLRGVLLGVCSKNEYENVKEVFDRHKHMPLNLSDISVVKCNWGDKATNLLEISNELNIDSSSMVFVDDNPAECELIRQKLPQIHVLNLKSDPAFFTRQLDSCNYFHRQHYSDDDFGRTASYQARKNLEKAKQANVDLSGYLKSLNMKCIVEEVTEKHLSRLVQMENKTNQFNLSTRRLSFDQMENMILTDNFIMYAFTLSDRFTNHGLVSYFSAKVEGHVLHVNDWLMSCRVFSRTLEEYVMSCIVMVARRIDVNKVVLHYKPTNKNKLMIDVFESLGFVSESKSNHQWVLSDLFGFRSQSHIQNCAEY